MCLYITQPFFSSLYALIQALSAYVLYYYLSIILSRYSCRGRSTSCCLRPFSLYLVASLAAQLAASFLDIPTQAGIYYIVTKYPLSQSSRTCCVMSIRMYAPNCPLALVIDQIAAQLSIYIAIYFRLLFLSIYSFTIYSTRLIPYSSTTYTVNSISKLIYIERVYCVSRHTTIELISPLILLLSIYMLRLLFTTYL